MLSAEKRHFLLLALAALLALIAMALHAHVVAVASSSPAQSFAIFVSVTGLLVALGCALAPIAHNRWGVRAARGLVHPLVAGTLAAVYFVFWLAAGASVATQMSDAPDCGALKVDYRGACRTSKAACAFDFISMIVWLVIFIPLAPLAYRHITGEAACSGPGGGPPQSTPAKLEEQSPSHVPAEAPYQGPGTTGPQGGGGGGMPSPGINDHPPSYPPQEQDPSQGQVPFPNPNPYPSGGGMPSPSPGHPEAHGIHRPSQARTARDGGIMDRDHPHPHHHHHHGSDPQGEETGVHSASFSPHSAPSVAFTMPEPSYGSDTDDAEDEIMDDDDDPGHNGDRDDRRSVSTHPTTLDSRFGIDGSVYPGSMDAVYEKSTYENDAISLGPAASVEGIYPRSSRAPSAVLTEV
ncbi:MAG: hypothetical protein DHS80DRAFT_26070 [Piptocephalis tieghemiana]|nr:MAG: hypothetical protein DHS80DRAFT_26070 [Piptocephalis tieghemiana]